MTVDLEGLTAPPRDDDGPVFREPWEARAFALVVRLHHQGLFSWREWVDALAAEVPSATPAVSLDPGTRDYGHWLRTLERLLSAKKAVTPTELDERTERWRHAYRATPHGQPVELDAGDPR